MHAANSAAAPRAIRTPAQAEWLTRRYPVLRSLEMAPISLCVALGFLIEGLGWIRPSEGLGPIRWRADVFPMVALLVPAVAATMWIRRYLNRTFGVVKINDVGWGSFALAVIAGLILRFALEAMTASVRLGVTPLFLGVWAMWLALPDHGLRRHWLIPAALFLAMPFVVSYHAPPAGRTPLESFSWATALAAQAFAQLWDHRLLVRSFNDGRTE